MRPSTPPPSLSSLTRTPPMATSSTGFALPSLFVVIPTLLSLILWSLSLTPSQSANNCCMSVTTNDSSPSLPPTSPATSLFG
ncbi:hypothetical protein BVRB_8g187710 [Beta vulgaris subsp. vulgaris]|uniref:Uncharacterized protein n=1 Tax=Beta vulgaris subsp. vulgaris TaxID=3555 RepID=A0A0J8BVE6_BETVV|nr:hypothetical protein BVRB_8g187710 [Beta vulgaris subsp. vulgaris]